MFAMQHYKLGWEDGLHMVQNRRYCISPNGGFLTQIKEYESIYRAQDSVSAYPMTTRQISRRKREEDDQDDEDILFREEDRKRIMVDSDEEPTTASDCRDPNAMDDS